MTDLDAQMSQFKNPGAIFRAAPFWSWNGKLEPRLLVRQFDDFAEMGFGGAHLHSRTGLSTPYLGDDFMECVRAIVSRAGETDRLAWLYDEDRWPSGAAGGLVTVDPEYRQRCLVFTPFKYLDNPVQKKTEGRSEYGRSGQGRLLSRYAVSFRGSRLTAFRRLSAGEEAGAGETDYHACLEIPPPSSWYNYQTYVDVLNPRAIRRFIEVTHERYRQVIGEQFGKAVPAIFTDEPLFTRKISVNPRQPAEIFLPWTDDLGETFLSVYGYDILDFLPQLIFDGLPGTERVRWCWHDHVAERFRRAFSEQIGVWCDEAGIRLTGHLESEETLNGQVARNGECMRFYHHMQLPGVDMLCDKDEYSTVLQARSVARQEGRDGVLSELYGVTNWDFDFTGHKRQGDWQAALGVTVRVPHLSWYTMKGEAKRDYPAPIDWHSPWWREYRYIEDHFARLNTALTAGTACVHVAVLHPVESMWMACSVNVQANDVRDQLEHRFQEIIKWLLKHTIDFDFVAESLLPEQFGGVADGGLSVGEMKYDIVIVPALRTIRSTTLTCLETMVENGGEVVFAGPPPVLVDGLPDPRARSLAERSVQIAWDELELLDKVESVREIRVCAQPGSIAPRPQSILYQLRRDDDNRWLFLCNTDRDQDFGILQAAAIGSWRVEHWNTFSGKVEVLDFEHKDGWTLWEWSCSGAGHQLIRLCPAGQDGGDRGEVEEKKKRSGNAPRVNIMTAERSLDNPVGYTLEEPNVMLLDRAWGSLDGQPEEEDACEILQLDNRWRGRLGWGEVTGRIAQPWTQGDSPADHRVCLRYRIESEIRVTGAKLALERAEDAIIKLDGREVTAGSEGYWVDEAIETVSLPDIEVGCHDLTVEVPYGRGTTLEWAYLLGSFGVRVQGRWSVLTALPETLAWGDITSQGLPFYAGNLIYHCRFRSDTAALSALSVHRYRAPLLRVALDGRDIGPLALPPYRLELGRISVGEHGLDIICFGNRRNAFGQVHHAAPEKWSWWGPASWRTESDLWSEEYVLMPHGILSAPRLLNS